MDDSPSGSSVHGFSWQEHWSGMPVPSPGDLPDPGIEPGSPALQADSLKANLPINDHYHFITITIVIYNNFVIAIQTKKEKTFGQIES